MELENRSFKTYDEEVQHAKQLITVDIVEEKSMVTKTKVAAVEEKARSPRKKRREYLEHRRYSSSTTRIGKKSDLIGMKLGSIRKLLETIGHGSTSYERKQNKIFQSTEIFTSFYSSLITKSTSSTSSSVGRRYTRAHLRQKMVTKIKLSSITSTQSKSSGDNNNLKYVGGNDGGVQQNKVIVNSRKSSNAVLSEEIDELADLFGKLSIVDVEEESLPYFSRTEISAEMKQNIMDVLESILEEMKHQSSTAFNNKNKKTNNKGRMHNKDQQYKGKWLLRNYM